MATMIPESINVFPNITPGEKRVFKILKELLPDDYIVWFDLRVSKRHPDFIILGPDLGLVVLEVKDWKLNSIKSADVNFFELETMGQKVNPLRQARTYMFNIVDNLKKDRELIKTSENFKGNLKFPFGHGVVFTNISRGVFQDSPFTGIIDEKQVIFQDDLKILDYSQNKDYLTERINNCRRIV